LALELSITEPEARKLQIATSFCQSFFLERLDDVGHLEFDLEAQSKLYLLENFGLKVSQMPLGLMSAFHFDTLTLLPEGGVFEASALVYRPNNVDAPARMRITNLSEDFSNGHLLMVTWSASRSKAVLLNLTTLGELGLENQLGELEKAEPSEEANSPTSNQDEHLGQVPGLLPTENRDRDAQLNPRPAPPSKPHDSAQAQSGVDKQPTQFDPVAELWARAYGGNSAAVSPWAPSMSGSWLGPTSPGLAEVEELATRVLSAGEDQIWIFLVGGPGSGKSSYASRFLDRNGYLIASGNELHRRHYLAQHPSWRPIRFVNDATVRTKGLKEGLQIDMAQADQSKSQLLTCVNRGVLADELNLTNDPSSEFFEVLDWIARGSDRTPKSLLPLVELDYMQVAKQALEDGSIRYIAAIYMDVASMLEEQPLVEHTGSFESLQCSSLKMQSSDDGKLLGSDASPFSILLQKISQTLSVEYLRERFKLSDLNPIVANANQLNDPEFRRGLISILRTSEIRVGSRLNYRSFWTILARLMFGDLPNKTDIDGLATKLLTIEQQVQNSGEFAELFELAGLRSTEAVFENRQELASAASFDPGLKFTLAVDPAIASSGEIGISANSTSDKSVYVKPIAHAFQSAEVGEGILDTISQQTGNPLPLKKTAFDVRLDSLFALARGSDSADRLSNYEVSSYARYLLRISSVYGGICHGLKEAQEWVALWSFSPYIPQRDQLTAKIESLIKPKIGRSDLQQTALLSLLESRARPIVQTSESEPILAKQLDNIQFSTTKIGADLFLVLNEYNTDIGRIKIDHSFLRELLNTSPFAVGVTEETYFLAPRLERTRSVKLLSSPDNQAEVFAVVVGDRVKSAFVDRKDAL